MNSHEYQITIKSANQKVDDYVTKCRSIWTVHRLKQHISETHVNKPNIEDQRLIYAGNLLKDSLTLKQIFFRDSLCTELTNSSKTDFTIHLVCSTQSQKPSSSSSLSSPAPTATQSNSQPRPQPAANTAPTGSSQQATTSIPSSNPTSVEQRSANSGNSGGSPGSAGQSTQAGPSSSSNTSLPQTPSHSTTPTTPMATSTQAAEIARNLMQSDQMRAQIEVFQQLANAVAAQIAQNLANTNSGSPTVTQANETLQFNNLFLPDLSSLFGGQIRNLTVQASGTNITTQTDTQQAASSVASQLLYAANRQPTQLAPQPTPAQSAGHQASPVDGLNQNENLNNQAGQQPQVRFLAGRVGQVPAQPVALDPQQQQQPPPAPAMGAAAAPPAVAPDVQVPVQVVEPAMQNDVIDWVYYSIRAALLVAVLYIHASLFRLIFISLILWVGFFFNRRRARAAPAAPVAPAAQPQPDPQVAPDGPDGLRRRNVNNQDDENNEQAQGEPRAAETDEEAAAAAAAAGQAQRLPFLKLCYLVVTDFLASLVPE